MYSFSPFATISSIGGNDNASSIGYVDTAPITGANAELKKRVNT